MFVPIAQKRSARHQSCEDAPNEIPTHAPLPQLSSSVASAPVETHLARLGRESSESAAPTSIAFVLPLDARETPSNQLPIIIVAEAS